MRPILSERARRRQNIPLNSKLKCDGRGVINLENGEKPHGTTLDARMVFFKRSCRLSAVFTSTPKCKVHDRMSFSTKVADTPFSSRARSTRKLRYRTKLSEYKEDTWKGTWRRRETLISCTGQGITCTVGVHHAKNHQHSFKLLQHVARYEATFIVQYDDDHLFKEIYWFCRHVTNQVGGLTRD